MKLKEYLSSMGKSLLNDEFNILILIMLEKKGYCSAEDLKDKIGISLETLNCKLKNLYREGLVKIDDSLYCITDVGADIISKLDLYEMVLTNLFRDVNFLKEERILYSELLKNYRKEFLYMYLHSMWFYNSDTKIIIKNYNKNDKDYNTDKFIIIFLYSIMSVLVTSDISNSMNVYNSYHKLFDYAWSNNCATQIFFKDLTARCKNINNKDCTKDVFNLNNKKWHTPFYSSVEKCKCDNEKFFPLKTHYAEEFHKFHIISADGGSAKTKSVLDFRTNLYNIWSMYIKLENSFKTNRNIFSSDNDILSIIMRSDSLEDLVSELHISKESIKLILATIKAKTTKLLE